MQPDLLVSIIVPVYNAEKYLPIFFKSLSNQECMKEKFELLFIDNGSTDNSRKLIKNYIQKNENIDVKYFYYDEVADSYAARNFGVRHSTSEIFAFTDSDCVLEPDWIKNIIKLSKPGTIISGAVEIQVLDSENIWEVFDSFAHLTNKENASKAKIATANLIVTKNDYFEIGLFEERYSGGDHDWSLRAEKLGFNIVYNEQIKVLHPSRKSFSEILNKSKRLAYGTGLNHRKNKKTMISLVILFSLKIFNFKTNIRYSKRLRERDFGVNAILMFNRKFMRMRIEQLKSATQGYRITNVRKLGIK